MAAMTPPASVEMSRNALDTINATASIAIRQELQWLEEIVTCCERRNKYKLSGIGEGFENHSFSDNELRELPMHLDVRENSSMCCRLCCANMRAFQMGFFPPGTAQQPKWPEVPPTLLLERPFKCTLWCGTLICPQQLFVSAEGRKLGRVEQDCRCCDCCCCCTCWLKSFDANGRQMHAYRIPFCGRNCCAPSCCNREFKIDIKNAYNEAEQVGLIRNIWPGWNWRGLCSPSATNFVVHFPKNASKDDKAIVVGSTFLIDFLFFEKRNNDDN